MLRWIVFVRKGKENVISISCVANFLKIYLLPTSDVSNLTLDTASIDLDKAVF